MGETLFISHRIPFPPDRGDKIRSHHLLKALAALGPVHVATLAETAGDFAAEPLLAEVATSYRLARRPANLRLAGLRAMAFGKPVSLPAFDSAALRNWIAHTLAERPIETIFVFSGQMGQYIPAGFAGRVVIDLCDVDSAKFDAYSVLHRGLRAWIERREGRLLAAEERRLAQRADTTLLVSKAEAALLRARIGEADADVRAIGNGIDTAFFDPRSAAPHPDLRAPGPHILFTGQMDYLPNIDAAKRAAAAIMPAIRAAMPAACLHIVGRAPTADVRALEGVNGTRVWGEVTDVRPFLAAADLVLAPLAIARGVQNKVLEAMAMARPVVLSPQAATGIDGEDGVHFAIADSDDALATRSLEMLASGRQAREMGAAARRFAVERMGWDAMLAPLRGILGQGRLNRDAA